MADVTKTVEILFTGEDNLSSKMDSIRSGFSSFEESISSITGPLASMAEGVLKAEAALAALAVGGMALAIKEAASFNDSFSEINTLAQLTGEGMGQFKDDILNYATSSTQSIEQINTAVYNAISMGADYSESLSTVKQAEQLAVAGKAELNSTLELLMGTMNAYGAETDEAARYSDAFFTIVKDGKTTIPELASSFSQISGIASSAGIDIETLGAALAAVTASGAPTSEAITGIKAAISNIIQPSAEAEKAAAALGVQFNAAALESKGLDGVLRDVYEATGGNVEKMGQLFGSVEGLNAALVLGADKSGTFAQALLDMSDKTGATQKAFETMSENAGLAMQNLANNIKAVLIEAGTPLLKQFGEDVGALSGVLQGVKLGFDAGAFDPLFDTINQAGAEFEKWLDGVAKAMPEALSNVDWSKLIESVKGLTGELGGLFTSLFGDVDLTKSEDLAKFIQKIIDGVAGLTNVTSGIVESWQPFLKMIGEAVDEFIDLDDSTQKTSGNVLGFGQAIDKLIEPIKTVLGAVDSIGISLGIMAASTAAKTISEIGSSAGTAGGLLNTFGGILTQSIGSATTGQTLGIMGLGYAVGYAAGKLLEEFVPGVKDASNAVADWLVDVLDLADGQEDINDSLDQTAKNLDHMKEKFGDIGAELDDLNSKDLVELKVTLEEEGMTIEEFNAAIDALPEEKQAEVILLLNQGKFDEAMTAIGQIPEEKTLGITADGKSVDELTAEINAKFPDEKEMEVKPAVNKEAMEKTTKTIEEKIPLEKQMEIQAKIDIANIEAEAKKVEAAFESMSKLGVAQIEADAEKYVAALESITTVAESTSDLLGNLFGLWGEADTMREKWDLEHYIEEQLDIQREQLDLQKGLIEEQIKYYQSRREALESGDAMIKVEAEGLEPEIEAFMWKILEKIQLRVQEEQAEFLLGLNPGGA